MAIANPPTPNDLVAFIGKRVRIVCPNGAGGEGEVVEVSFSGDGNVTVMFDYGYSYAIVPDTTLEVIPEEK